MRVWEEVWAVYREVAKKYGLKISDLVSIVLLYAPILAPLALVYGLEDNYPISREAAMSIASELKDSLAEMVAIAAEAGAIEAARNGPVMKPRRGW